MLYRPALHVNWNALSLAGRALKEKFPTPTVPLKIVLQNRQVFLPDPVYLSSGCRPGGDQANTWHWTKRLTAFFSNNKKQQPQLLPHFLAYRVPREGIYSKYNYNMHYLNNIITIRINNIVIILYIKMNVCLFVCMYVCMYVCMELIQIQISEPIWIKLCTRLPFGLEETVGYVWTRNSWPLRPFGPFFFGGHCRIMGTRWLPARPFSAMPLYPWFQLVFVWRRRLRSHPRQPYIRDSNRSSCHVAEMTS